MGKADHLVIRFKDTIVIIAPAPVFLQVDEEHPFGLDTCSQVQGLLKGIESGS
jgi:hypothetical protein